MKINIRNNVFETNSSSSHSLSIPETLSNDLLDTLTPDEEGVVFLHGGEFGWGYDTYNDAQTKASYLAVYCHSWYDDHEINGILLSDILKNVIKTQTGCNDVVFNFGDNNKDNWVYIDHQSVESEDYHFLFEDTEQMRNFIFSKDAQLIIDNDNH